MQKIKRIVCIALACLLYVGALTGCSAFRTDETVERMLCGMSAEDKIAQMMIIAPRRYNGADVTQLNEPFAKLFAKYAFGGAILFTQNTASAEQTVCLTDSLQNANAKQGRPQLLIAIDQEGGVISRLKTGTQMPGNMALGAIGKRSAAQRAGRIIGEELSALGIQVDFAPVLDVNENPANPVIGVRSFSDDPEVVSNLGKGMIKGLHRTGVMTAVKHFPGHGDTETDSHVGLPLIRKTYDELKRNELIPFAAGIDAGTEMIMTAHIQYPSIETGTYRSKSTGEDVYLPASLSKTILTDILRGDMGYDGIIVTDSLSMDAIKLHFEPIDAITLAVNAGANMLLMPNVPYSDAGIAQLEKLIAAAAARVENGSISAERVDDSVRRILKLKAGHGMLHLYDSGDLDMRIAAAVGTVGSKAHHDKEFELAKRAVTLVRNRDGLLPIRTQQTNVLILTAYANEVLSAQYAKGLLEERGLLAQGKNVTVECLDKSGDEALQAKIADADVVIAISELTKAEELDPESAAGAKGARLDRLIEQTHRTGAKFVLLSAHLPYDCARFPDADAVVVCWSDQGMRADPGKYDSDIPQYGPNIPAAIYMMFAPDEKITGKLPVRIPAIREDYTFSDESLFARGFGLTY